jgi:hypothetical protein
MQAIARRWARRAGVALLAGGLASLSYYALRFVRAGLSEKLLGDAYRLTYRLTQHQQLDRHYYAKVLVLNALLYATWILVAFAGKDLLAQARKALSNNNMRQLVPYEIEREIPFNVDESAGRAQPTTPKKPAIARVNRP